MPSKRKPPRSKRGPGRPRASVGDPQVQIDGPALLRIIKARGLAQIEVVRRMGERGEPISGSLLNVLANDRADSEGRRRETSLSIVTALSEVLEVHRSWLLAVPLPDVVAGSFVDGDGRHTPITYGELDVANERAIAIRNARAPAAAAVATRLTRAGATAGIEDVRGLFVRTVEHFADELCNLQSRRRDLLVSTGPVGFSTSPDDAEAFARCVQTAVDLLLGPVFNGEAVVRRDAVQAAAVAIDLAVVRRFWPEAHRGADS